MKRFHWPLERLLTVTMQRETAARAELQALSGRIAALRQECMVRHAALRAAAAELSGRELQDRMQVHGLVMRCCDSQRRQIERLDKQIAELAAQRTAKTAALTAVRRRRETMERLRSEAKQRWAREQTNAEQKQFDEGAQMARARQMMAVGMG